MQIVIDVPEKIYKAIKEDTYCGILDADVYYAIKDGTPLPKGHGRLINADELQDYFEDNRSKLFHSKDCIIGIDNMPTIIEADESEREVQDAISN